MKPHILIVEDEEDVRNTLMRLLTTPDKERDNVSYGVTAVRDGNEMRRAINQNPVDLFILDIRLKDADGRDLEEDGLALTKWLRDNSDVIIMIYSGMAEEVDEIAALDLGADEYLRKPSSPKVIRARVGALLRRRERHIGPFRSHLPNRKKVAKFGGFRFEIGSRVITLPSGENMQLSYSEHDFLSALVESPNGQRTREELNAFVLGSDMNTGDRRLDNLVNRLRHKLKEPTIIRALHGQGYRLNVSVELSES